MATPDAPVLTSDEEPCDLSLQEAARLYGVPVATLSKRVRWGQIDAYKVRGPWGHQWRVSREALEAFGYRQVPPSDEEPQDPRVAELEREVASLRRVLAAERVRADRADRELGQLMLESGRLRSALARARAASGEDSGGSPEPDPVVMWVPSTGSAVGRR